VEITFHAVQLCNKLFYTSCLVYKFNFRFDGIGDDFVLLKGVKLPLLMPYQAAITVTVNSLRCLIKKNVCQGEDRRAGFLVMQAAGVRVVGGARGDVPAIASSSSGSSLSMAVPGPTLSRARLLRPPSGRRGRHLWLALYQGENHPLRPPPPVQTTLVALHSLLRNRLRPREIERGSKSQ